MADKILKTRIKLLTKSYSEWQEIKSTFVPLDGEICIVKVPSNAGTVANEPALLFKVGDGEHAYDELGFSSALSADVYSWAKKENLDWNDLDASFLAKLDEHISEEAPSHDTQYQIVPDGDLTWKLQKSVDDGDTWVDATGNISVAQAVADLEAAVAKKVDKTIEGTNGKALIFNESDGGGAKFEHNDGTWSFVGVNDGGKNGLTGQIYSVNKDTKTGTRLNMTVDGFFYTKKNNATYTADDELVTKKDIKSIEGGMHFIGATTKQEGETLEQAIERVLQEKSHTPVSGDIIIVGSRENIYDGEAWVEVGDEDNYATKAALAAEVEAREQAIANEISAREAEDEALDQRLDAVEETLEELDLPRDPELTEIDGVPYFFCNGTPVTIEDDGTQNVVKYFSNGATDTTPLSINVPYTVELFGGGDGREDAKYYESSMIIVNGGQFKTIHGGNFGAGHVGNASIVVNNTTLLKNLYAGGEKGSALPYANSTGHAKIVINNGTIQMLVGGGIDIVNVGSSEIIMNGGNVNMFAVAGGTNGWTAMTRWTINGGHIAFLIGGARGTASYIDYELNGGTIDEWWAASGDDSSDTARVDNVKLALNAGTVTTLRSGNSMNGSGTLAISGSYTPNVTIGNSTVAISECNLTMDTLILDCNL